MHEENRSIRGGMDRGGATLLELGPVHGIGGRYPSHFRSACMHANVGHFDRTKPTMIANWVALLRAASSISGTGGFMKAHRLAGCLRMSSKAMPVLHTNSTAGFLQHACGSHPGGKNLGICNFEARLVRESSVPLPRRSHGVAGTRAAGPAGHRCAGSGSVHRAGRCHQRGDAAAH